MPRSLFLHHFRVLEQRDTAALNKLSLERDRFAAGIGQFIVDRFVFTDDEVGFAVLNDSDRAAVFDALGTAGLSVAVSHRVVIDITHHVDNFAGHSFLSSGIGFAVFVMGQR